MNYDKSGWRPNILHDAPYKLHGVDPLWRWFAIAGWILVMILAAVAARGSVVTTEFLDAMECIESGMDARAVGDQGRSRGSFQFHAAGWQMVNGWRARALKPVVPFSVGAHCRSTARQFAFEYLRWLESHLAVALRRSPSRLELYAAWNLGLKGFEARGFLLGRCPAGTRDAAGRLENLVRKFIHNNTLVMIKAGDNGWKFFAAKQRASVEKVRARLGL